MNPDPIDLPSIPAEETIRKRFSCRSCSSTPISQDVRDRLAAYLAKERKGPFGRSVRMGLVAATPEDAKALKGLGTYGFVRGATGFVVGAMVPGPYDLEDFGYLVELAILYATHLGLGTCWLGGTFTRSRFARKIELRPEEQIPAVFSLGHVADPAKAATVDKRRVRLPSDELFFEGSESTPIGDGRGDEYAAALEMVRLAPSASNKQPWRVVREGANWHFFLKRTKGYGKGTLLFRVLGLADLQRVDVGIAMAHFELTARGAGCSGKWERIEEAQALSADMHYTATWCAG